MKYIFFDLDGTLLPLDNQKFLKAYYQEVQQKFSQTKFNPKLIIAGINEGLAKMFKNDDDVTNDRIFWDGFYQASGYLEQEVHDIFIDFYNHEFLKIKNLLKDEGYSKKIVAELKAKGYQLVLATNPLFPKVAQLNRMALVGLKESDFIFITDYENSTKLKPNHHYFKEIMDKLSINAEDVLMVGNDVNEDLVAASKAAINAVLIDDFMINAHDLDYSKYDSYSLASFYQYVQTLPSIKK